MVNPTDGPLGENPGWQGFTLPGLQGPGYWPLLATMIVAPVVSLWHLPLYFWEPGGLQASVLVGGLVVTVAATFFTTGCSSAPAATCSWLSCRTTSKEASSMRSAGSSWAYGWSS
jgi:hypothetical protein